MYRKDVDMDAVGNYLQEIVSRVKSSDDPETLVKVKKVFKKNVPFSLRGYVAAYLAKEAARHYNPNYHRERRDFSENRPYSRPRSYEQGQYGDVQERIPRPVPEIDPAVSKSIFVNIGRNRHIRPADLVRLFIEVGGLERERIGNIRILANFSFVQVYANDAEKAIAALNGYPYRGYNLSVTYSKSKGENADAQGDENVSYGANDESEENSASNE